ncbi:MAG: NUDIX domain-containing protein [Caldilineaceae bacterium]|nr:NUDIX domain-containing protein [Caldilineaceae bacterium]
MSEPMELIKATANQFGGLVLDKDDLPSDAAEFNERLRYSLDVWRREGFKVVWFEAVLALAALIPAAVENGFTFHHSAEGYVMMTIRLEDDAFIPPYATHYIGAGGVVLNEKRDLLVVSERFRRDKSRPYWKLPGGALHPGEHLADGVLREVYEETGVRAKFDALVCFRHWHGYRYGKSDIYFICRLRPLSQEIDMDTFEIDACQWMPVEEYLASEFVGDFNKQIVRAALESPGLPQSWVEGYSNPVTHEFFMPSIAG